MTPTLNTRLPAEQATRALAPRMPGIAPTQLADWIVVSDTYAPQMALRRRLINSQRERVLAEQYPEAAKELFETVVAQLRLRPDFEVSDHSIRCPDGHEVRIGEPLETLAQVVQEDFCLLMPEKGAYIMRAAVLCFPASWTLAEKLSRPLLGIHEPVAAYTDDLAKRVQRLFDAIRPEAPLWRANALFYDDPWLFHPASEAAPRVQENLHAPYLRSERQTLVRLPKTGAVAFSIHTYILAREAVDPNVIQQLEARHK
ncbi:DUF3445 domain-containing protein [Falsihalocynthiibacter sp. SS001]|uniref:heme-dependent oxidative N-demethylase family protein n=1 Tax=Falsihalocynthiibacter sp. SS001 TaxID=3349698 RepID=UPI0036D245E0